MIKLIEMRITENELVHIIKGYPATTCIHPGITDLTESNCNEFQAYHFIKWNDKKLQSLTQIEKINVINQLRYFYCDKGK